MLTDLEGDPLVKVVGTPHSAFMLEAKTSRLCKRVYAPLIREGGLFDSAMFDEDGKCLSEDGFCGKGPNKGPLSFERDRFGGIDRGIVGHEVIDRRLKGWIKNKSLGGQRPRGWHRLALGHWGVFPRRRKSQKISPSWIAY